MSISILKRSLEIVDEDETKKKQKKSSNNKKNHNNLFDFDEKKEKRKTIVEVKKELSDKSQKSAKNIEKLLKLSKTKVEPVAAQKLLQRARTGKYVLKVEDVSADTSSKNQESIFTDEDFELFAKELEVNS